jgi:hypothetical protein
MRFGFVVVAAVLGGLPGCDSGATECACPATGLTVNLPPGLAGGVVAWSVSGEACTGARVTCTSDSATSCTTYHVAPAQAGACSVGIDFANGTSFTDDVTVVSTGGCCAGLRADPPSAGEIDVPAPVDAGDD